MSSEKFKKILVSITVISTLFTFLFGSDIDYINIANNEFSPAHLKNILFSVSSSVLASTILLWGIDSIHRRENEKELDKIKIIIYKNLKEPLNNYYSFYLNLYIATRKSNINSTHPVLKSLSSCKDEFNRQILETVPFCKKSYLINPNAVLNSSEKTSIAMERAKFVWYDCWKIEADKSINSIENLINIYSFFIPADLLLELTTLVKFQKYASNGIKLLKEYPNEELNTFNLNYAQKQYDLYVKSYKFFDALKVLEKCIIYIENHLNEEIRSRSIDFFNNQKTISVLDSFREKSST